MSEPETKSELTGLGELQAGELSIPGPAVRMPPREKQQCAHPHPQDGLCSIERAGQRAGTAARWGRHYHSSRVFSPRYLFFCEEGMWGIYHRVTCFRQCSSLLYEREAAETDGWGGGGGGGSRLNLWPQQWGSYVTHPEAQGRYHGASGL